MLPVSVYIDVVMDMDMDMDMDKDLDKDPDTDTHHSFSHPTYSITALLHHCTTSPLHHFTISHPIPSLHHSTPYSTP